jgi:hypothetical protein
LASILPAEKASIEDAGVLEPALLVGDLEDRVARPIAVTDLKGGGGYGRLQRGQRKNQTENPAQMLHVNKCYEC